MSGAHFASIDEAIAFGDIARRYADARIVLAGATAKNVLRAVRRLDDWRSERNVEEAYCAVTHGHRWTYTGTAYGGDDERWHGEGRCYCCYCGADGDA